MAETSSPERDTSGPLLQLAERCEQATGADRELDGAIHCANHSLEGVEREKAMARIGVFGPRYTASLDAAMTLVPEGWDAIRIERTRLADDVGTVGYKAEIMEIGPRAEGFARGEALTRPLALTAAALRARAADRNTQDGGLG